MDNGRFLTLKGIGQDEEGRVLILGSQRQAKFLTPDCTDSGEPTEAWGRVAGSSRIRLPENHSEEGTGLEWRKQATGQDQVLRLRARRLWGSDLGRQLTSSR